MEKDNKKSKKKVITWAAVSAVVLVFMIVVNVICTTWLYSIISLVVPGSVRPKYADGTESYYISDYTSKEDVFKSAKDFNVKLAEEGIVLLKNNDKALPLSSGMKVSVFGKNSVNLAYGGSGSSGVASSSQVDLYSALSQAGFEINPVLKSFYEDEGKSGAKRQISGTNLDSGDTVVLSTAETPQDKYTDDVKKSYADYNDAAIIVITRVGGEGMDLPRLMVGAEGYRNEDDHFLQLDANEEDMIAQVCNAGFKKVVVVLNTCNAMELGFLKEDSNYVTRKGYSIDPSKIDAALWMGYPGDTGNIGLANVLSGAINPSGHTVDTYVTDLKADPTWVNFGDNTRTANKTQNGGDQYTLDGVPQLYYFVDYEENLYVGYRYYETRGAEDEKWYSDSVVYPFGYGLSYTTFEWSEIDAPEISGQAIDKEGEYTVKVKVTNTGDVAGKDVVQLYGHAPYNAGGIEKPQEVLLDFAKTSLLQPGESQVVELTFTPYYLASYDCYDDNGNGFAGYELESGDYALYVSHDAHTKEAEILFSVQEDIRYENSTVDENVTVQNLFTDQDDPAFNSDTQLSVLLSRSDWEKTWPTTPDETDWAQDKSFFAQLDDVETNNPTDYSEYDMPDSEMNNGMKIRDLLFDENGKILDADNDGIPFVEYDDERWDTLLDQAKYSELINMYDTAAYTIAKVESIGAPTVNCADGPVGWTCFMQASTYKDCCNYVAQMVAASSWNEELMEQYGQMLGDEGIVGDPSSGAPYSGIYAPGANIHRSAFGGRNAEYCSEDPVLTGKMAAAEIKGLQSKGVFAFVKHFALNEQETHRSISGDCSWVTEQAMREIYLRGFEIAVKEGQTRAVMSSFNRIGTRWTGGDYRLLTTILRDEWGFKGCVLCDFNTIPAYMNSRQMAYAGGDLNLTTSATAVSWCDESSIEDAVVMRNNAKNVMYTVVNSNAMGGEIIGYKTPLWIIGLICLDVLVAAIIALTGFFTFRKKR